MTRAIERRRFSSYRRRGNETQDLWLLPTHCDPKGKDIVNWLESRKVLMCVLALVTIAWALWVNPDSYLTNDEAIYHLTTKALVQEGNFFLSNGYEEFPSQELVPDHSIVHNGRLYPQYPVFFSIIAYPFVYFLDFKGLFLLNTIALLGTVLICHRLAKFMFHDPDLATNACLILLFATYAWEYGQAAWPHAVSVFLVILAVYLANIAYRSSPSRSSAVFAISAGVAAGLGVGVRLDAVLVLPAIIVPFVFASPWRPREVLAIFAGAAPALGALALTNYAKFGVISPFSYAPASYSQLTVASYLPLIALSLGVVAVVWLVTRQPVRDLPRNRRAALVGSLVLGAAVSVAALDLWGQISHLASGAFRLLVDLSIEEGAPVPKGAVRGPGGALIYIGSVKKALLQSCPYLAALAIPAVALIRGGNDRGQISILFLIPGAFVVFYAYRAWHGGGALNLRYFLPVLPFTSILVAYAWRELNNELSNRWSLPRFKVAAVTAFVFLGLLVLGETAGERAQTFPIQEIMFRAIPLVVFSVSLGLIFILIFSGTASRSTLRGACSLLLIGAFVWSGLTAFNNDYFRAFAFRKARAIVTESLVRVVEPDSIVFTNAPNNFYRLLVEQRSRIAFPYRDRFKDFQALRQFYSERGRAIYVWLDQSMEEAVQQHRLFANLEAVEVFDPPGPGRLVRLLEPVAPTAAPTSGVN